MKKRMAFALPALVLQVLTVIFAVINPMCSSVLCSAGEPEESIYYRDWYSPNPDWRTDMLIREFSCNTRVPDLVWVNYEGAYTQGLRIRPIDPAMIQKQIDSRLIDAKRAEDALTFSAERETANARYRTVRVTRLAADVSDVIEVSFKMKATVQNAGANLLFNTGLGIIDTSKHLDPDTVCQDGFKAYKITFPARPANARLNDISITVDPMQAADASQEFIIIDLVYRFANKRMYVKELPARTWSIDGGRQPIDGVYTYMNSSPSDPGVTVADLPIRGWAPRDPNKDKNINIEYIKVKLPNSQTETDAVRFTITTGERAYLACPVTLDGLKFNTMSFLYKIEVPAGSKVVGDSNPPVWGWPAAKYAEYFDTFGVSYISTRRDVIDWPSYGVCMGHAAWHRQKNEPVGDGWNVFALDTANDDMDGNKDFSREALTHWTIHYKNSKIPAGEKVVITIANPKAASGIMRTGGDMDKYREFKSQFSSRCYDYSDSAKYLESPESGRLEKPLPIMRDGFFEGEIVVTGGAGYQETRQYAAEELKRLIQMVAAPLNDVPILSQPSEKENVKIFVGGWDRCKTLTDEQKKLLAQDYSALSETPGCAIRTFGQNIFLFGGAFQYSPKREFYPGTGKGALNAVYLFMENNTDLIQAGCNTGQYKPNCDYVYTRITDGQWSIVWGDGLFIPPAKSWFISGIPTDNMCRNLGTRGGWHIDRTGYQRGLKVNKSVNHWFGWGARDKVDIRKPNEKWGLGEDGQRMFPDCYTGHPCLINVLEDAKLEYVESGMSVYGIYRNKESRYWEITNMIALWLEDTMKICVCDKCTTPIRLPDGSLVLESDIDFRSTQFHAQTNAMIQAWNVYVDQTQLVETIAYFWEWPIPRCPVSRQIQPRFCPYVRKNYKEPIFAPINDTYWRNIVLWAQIVPHSAVYEYFLGVNFRPFADVNQFDYKAELDLGIRNGYCYEGDSSKTCEMERWVMYRQMWDPEADPIQLRKFYIRRTYREAAPDMEKFWFKLHQSYYDDPTHVDYEEMDELRLGQWLMWTPSQSPHFIGKTLADELSSYMDDAVAHVKHPIAKIYVENMHALWTDYLTKAKEFREKAGVK